MLLCAIGLSALIGHLKKHQKDQTRKQREVEVRSTAS